MALLVLCCLFVGLYLFWHFHWKRRHLPPGPVPLPLLGNTLELARHAPGYSAYRKWAEQFGGVYTFWLGEDPVVVVSDFDTMHSTFVRDGEAVSGRHLMTAINEVLTASGGGNYGVIRTEGERWRAMRRFALHALRDLGMGKSQLEQKFLDDLDTLVINPLETELSNGSSIHRLEPLIDQLAGSTISQMLFGYGFSDKETLDEFYQLKGILEEQRRTIVTIGGRMLMGMPFLRHLPGFSATFAKFDGQVSATYQFFERHIGKRMAGQRGKKNGGKGEGEGEKDGGERPKDLLQCFLDRMGEEEEKEGKGWEQGKADEAQHFNLQNLRSLCYDLFLAGQETICITLNFLILYLLLDQRSQQKMQNELDEYVKRANRRERQIRMEDRPHLPFVNAVINETQRVCNLLPLNLTHRTTRRVQVGKFVLPKGVAIVPQISSVLYDEAIFPEPEKFEPERFLDEKGLLKRIEQFVPFSLGKRQCLGESLARMELFLFTANFFLKFRVFPADPLKAPTARKQLGFGVFAHPFSCRLERRVE